MRLEKEFHPRKRAFFTVSEFTSISRLPKKNSLVRYSTIFDATKFDLALHTHVNKKIVNQPNIKFQRTELNLSLNANS